MTAWNETAQLWKGFMRLRHNFPNKQGRSMLRRWINMMFSLKQLEYDSIIQQKGKMMADRCAVKWRADARKDLSTCAS